MEVVAVKTGAKATNCIRELINERDDEGNLIWKSTDESQFRISKEGDEQLKKRRIDWKKLELEDDENGRL